MANTSTSLSFDGGQSPVVPVEAESRDKLKYKSVERFLARRVFSPDGVEWTRTRLGSTTMTGRVALRPSDIQRAARSVTGAAAGQPRATDNSGTQVLQRWEGIVREVHGSYFEALLTPMSDGSPEVIADVSLDAVGDSDVELVRPGATFYLQAGRARLRTGMTVAYSSVIMRRLGNWYQEDLDLLRERGAKRRSKFEFR